MMRRRTVKEGGQDEWHNQRVTLPGWLRIATPILNECPNLATLPLTPNPYLNRLVHIHSTITLLQALLVDPDGHPPLRFTIYKVAIYIYLARTNPHSYYQVYTDIICDSQ